MAATEKKTRTKRAKAPLTTRDNLSALIGSAHKILRKDKGLNGDVDRLPLLTWVMFLKFLDDLEVVHEEEAELDGKPYHPIIEAPYRWRDWAAREDGLTGDELLAFINQDECHRADGSRSAGLFAYLRGLAGSGEQGSQREVIANVFRGVQNRMVSGHLLRDIINKINGIHFSASEEIHTLSQLYESMLRELRDAAGDSGEFYTPRPVVRFMVQVTDPRLGETVLDPACGTGGFLVEAYDHLNQQVTNPDQRRPLQRETLFGQEAKPLPYMLAQMNLLLHGLEAPQIAYGNTLERRLTEIGHSERVYVILTNPPFGGEEEAGIKANFPANMQTAETALLFLQYIMRKLRYAGHGAERGGRAAVVVPNSTLFGDGVCAVIKEELLKELNLHTIVRLPQGVFAPYTDIPANLLFFQRGGPTGEIWYYELPQPEGRKKYSKTAPLQFEEFAPLLAWWHAREEGPQAWKVDFAARRAAAVVTCSPPAVPTSTRGSPSTQENDGHEEEQVHGGADHRVPQAGRGRHDRRRALLGRFGLRPARPSSAIHRAWVGQIYFGVDNFHAKSLAVSARLELRGKTLEASGRRSLSSDLPSDLPSDREAFPQRLPMDLYRKFICRITTWLNSSTGLDGP